MADRLGNGPCAAGGSGGQGAPVRDNHSRHTWKAECVEELWQIGWVTGPARLVAAVGKAHQFVTFTVASNLQRAVAYGLDHEAGFYTCACPTDACVLSLPVNCLGSVCA